MDILTYAMLNKKLAGKASLVDGKVPASELPETSIDDLADTAIDDPENGEVLKYDADQGKWVNGTASGGGGTSDYTDLTNKPKINNVTLSGSKTGADLGLVDAETGKGLSTNDFTDAEKTKLSGIESGAEVNVQADWEQSDDTADDFIKNKPTIPTVNDATLTVQKNGTTVDTFTANASQNKTINITVPTSAADVSALPASTKYGASITLAIDSSTYVVTATLKDQDGNTLGSAQTIDLPLETMVVSGSYDAQTEKIVLTLKNGSTVEFSVAALVSGLQSEITAQSPLDADLVDDSTSTNKFVTAADKTAWDAKSNFSGSYTDLTNKPTLGAAAAKNVDASPTASSTNLVESGGVATALAGKQATLTTAQQAAADSGITSAKVAQYDKDSAATAELVDVGAKNRAHPEQYIKATWIDFSVDDSEPGEYRVFFGTLLSTDTDATTCAVRLGLSGGGFVSDSIQCDRGNNVSVPIVATDKFNYVRIYYSDNNAHSSGDSATINDIMLCTAADWAVSQQFVPYCPTMAEMYEMIKALQQT